MSDKFQPPKSAAGNARKVLRWREEHGDEVKGMTRTGWVRARQLASGGKISAEIVKRMAAFNRHRKNAEVSPEYKNEPWRDRGYVAWLGWGGTTGIEWAIRTSEGIKNEIKAEFPMNEIKLFGVVGTDVRASDVSQFLKDNDGLPVRVLIDSPGGALSEGVLIYNMLKDHSGDVTTVNIARAYSIASYIFLAGSIRQMNDNALLMTHEARVDASALTESGVKQIESMLSAANASIRKAYARTMGIDEAMVQTLWDGGSDVWYTSEQALESNLSTETIVSGETMSAQYINELMAIAPQDIVNSFLPSENGDEMSDTVKIDALENLGCPAGFILEQLKNEATELEALRSYIQLLNEDKDEPKDEEDEDKKDEPKDEEMDEDKEEPKDEEMDEDKEEVKDEDVEYEEKEGRKEDVKDEEEDEPKDEDKEEVKDGGEDEDKEGVKDEDEDEEKDEPKDEEEKDNEPKALSGAEPVATARQGDGRFVSAMVAWKQQIADRCKETGCSSTDAVIFLNKTNPGLRQMVIDEANN